MLWKVWQQVMATMILLCHYFLQGIPLAIILPLQMSVAIVQLCLQELQ